MRRVLIPQHISLTAPSAGSAIFDFRGETMGTTWSVKLAAVPVAIPNWRDELQRGIQNELDTVVAQMSHWLHDSDLGRFNRAEAGSWQKLPDAFFEVLTYALSISEISDGAYDPTAGALVNIWGFGPTHRYDEPNFHLPDIESIERAKNHSGRQHLQIDIDNQKIRQRGGLLLDLSAVAKGYGVDRVAQYLERCGVLNYLVEVGGELRGAGIKPDQMPWWVALEQPTPKGSIEFMPAAIADTIVALHGLSIATSGDYRRFYQTSDLSISHTIDPRNGYPIRNNIASVTVLHSSCMTADALSTALTVLGVDDGLAFAETHRVAARFLIRNELSCNELAPDENHFSERSSSAFQAMLQE